MADTFTYFEKFGDVCEALTEEDRKALAYAITMYGMFGQTVELPYPHNAYFTLIQDSIEQSKNARTNGFKGGRPKEKPMVSETRKPLVSETEKPGVSETRKPVVSGNGKAHTIPNHTVPNHTEPNNGDASDSEIPFAEIIEYLNSKTGKHLKDTPEVYRKPIRARWREGYRLDAFKRVIDIKCAQWSQPPKPGKDDMRPYRRPQTLFGTKFDAYLNEEMPEEVRDYGKYDR